MEEYIEDILIPNLQCNDDQKSFIIFIDFLKKVITKQK